MSQDVDFFHSTPYPSPFTSQSLLSRTSLDGKRFNLSVDTLAIEILSLEAELAYFEASDSESLGEGLGVKKEPKVQREVKEVGTSVSENEQIVSNGV